MNNKKIVAGLMALTFVFGGTALPNTVVSSVASVITAKASDAETWTSDKDLTSDFTIDGSVVTNSDIILNGHTLTINGDLYMTAGMLDIGTGKLVVNGNLYIGKEYASSYAYIRMQNSSASITVTGDLIWNVNSKMTNTVGRSNWYTYDLITAGTINVGGDVYDYISSTSNTNAFVMMGTSVLNLNGTGIQTIKCSYFGMLANLTVTNNRTVDMEGYFYSPTPLASDLNIRTQKGLKIDQMFIGGKTVNITGNVTQYVKNIELGGGTLNITGTFTAEGGMTKLGGGKLNVNGDYRIAKVTSRRELVSTEAGLDMTDSNDVVNVSGDFIIMTYSYATTSKVTMTSGKVYVGGNLDIDTAKITFGSDNTVYMNGTGSQTVKLKNTKGQKIYNLVLMQDRSNYNSDIDNHAKTVSVEIQNSNPTNPTYPTNIKADHSEKYHQIRFTWDKVENAEQYGIAVYLAGKWRVQTQDITDTTYTTPKNLTPGKTYKVAIAAKVDGKWYTSDAIKNAITVTVK